MNTGRSRASTGLAATGAALVVAGLLAWAGHDPTVRSPDEGRDPTYDRSARTAAAAATATPEPVLALRRPGAPRLVSIPALGVAAPVVPVEAPDGTLVPPADAEQLGWWAEGARPGAARGSALIAGHTVHTGGGALQDLEQLERGQRIVVRTDRDRLVYKVARVRVYSKGRLSRHAERIFSQSAPGRLILITCEDWDGRQYLSNVVVTATPVDV